MRILDLEDAVTPDAALAAKAAYGRRELTVRQRPGHTLGHADLAAMATTGADTVLLQPRRRRPVVSWARHRAAAAARTSSRVECRHDLARAGDGYA
jgi:citrate lyase beta subunit